MSGGCAVGVANPILGARVGIGDVRTDPGVTHRRGVEPGVMGVCREQVHRPFASDLVEPFPSRRALPERVGHPAVATQGRVHRLGRDPIPNRSEDSIPAHHAGQVDTELGQRHRSQMVVRVNEARQAHTTFEVDEFGCTIDEVVGTLPGAHMHQVASTHHDRLRPRLIRIAGPNRTVGQQKRLRHASHANPGGCARRTDRAVQPRQTRAPLVTGAESPLS